MPTVRVPVTASPQGLHWFALRLFSRREFAVQNALREAGVEEFLPTFVTESRWSDRLATVTKPLFACYIFARFDPAGRGAILAIRGVFQILSLDSKPVPIPDDEIASLRIVCESRLSPLLCAYVTGEEVSIKTGPLSGVTGIVVRTKGSTRVIVRCEILNRAVSVEVKSADLETFTK